MTILPARNVVSLGLPAYELHLRHPDYLPSVLEAVVLAAFGENTVWEVIQDSENFCDDDFDVFFVGDSLNADLVQGAVYAALATIKAGWL